jgi:hypothetical protein
MDSEPPKTKDYMDGGEPIYEGADQDAEHIAAFNPETALRLLATNAALTERLHTVKREKEEYRVSLADLYDAVGEPDHEGTLDMIRDLWNDAERLRTATQQRDRYAAALRAMIQQSVDDENEGMTPDDPDWFTTDTYFDHGIVEWSPRVRGDALATVITAVDDLAALEENE